MHGMALALVCLACVGQALIMQASVDQTAVDKTTDISNEVQALALLLQSLNPRAGWQAMSATPHRSAAHPRATGFKAGLDDAVAAHPSTEMDAKHEKTMGELQLGSGIVVEGAVSYSTDSRAFIDIGTGTDALLFKHEISSEYISSVKDVLTDGNRIKAMVLNIDRKDKKVYLSTKYLEPKPGDMINNPELVFEKAEEMGSKCKKVLDQLRVGDIVEGVVTTLKNFGAFINIGTGSDALLHLADISSEYVPRVEDVLSEGSKIKAVVIEKRGRKIDLSTKCLEPKPGDMIKNPELVFERAEQMGTKFKNALANFQPGTIVEGVVVGFKNTWAFVDIGPGNHAVLHKDWITSESPIYRPEDVLQKGSRIKAVVLKKKGGQVSLSTKDLEPEPGDMINNPELVFERAEAMAAKFKETFDNLQPGIVVNGVVTDLKDAGAFVNIGIGKPAFLHKNDISSEPISNITDVLSEGSRIKAVVLEKKFNEITLSTKCLEPEPGDMIKNPGLVFERADDMGAKHKQSVDNLKPGIVVEGVVTDFKDSGVVIDIGAGSDAMLHTNEISSGLVSNVKDLLSKGSRIKAMVLNKKGKKITLNTKYLEPEPGDMINNPELVFERAEAMGAKFKETFDNLQPGTVVEGIVTDLTDGAFVNIGSGKPASLPKNEISFDPISNVKNVLSKGSRIKAVVLSKNQKDGKISLSTKYLEPEPGDMIKNPKLVFEKADEIGAKHQETLDKLQPGILVEGIVTELKDLGAVIDIGVGKPVSLHKNEISSGFISKVEDVFSQGSRIKAVVLNKNEKDGKITLSTKYLEPEPGDMIKNPKLVFERAEEINAKLKERFANMQPGLVVEGIVADVKASVAFINIGTGKLAVLHKNEISSDLISNVEDVLSEGSRIKAVVLEKRSNEIVLGTKCLEPEPGDMIKNPELVFDRAEEMSAKHKETLDSLL